MQLLSSFLTVENQNQLRAETDLVFSHLVTVQPSLISGV